MSVNDDINNNANNTCKEESISDTYDMLILPQNFNLSLNYENDRYHLLYIEYFYNITEKLLDKSVAFVKQQFEPISNEMKDDNITITSSIYDNTQEIRISIITSNPEIYLFGMVGELFTQTMKHSIRNNSNDNYNIVEVFNLRLEQLQMYLFPLITMPYTFDSDLATKENNIHKN